jgi:hypothetical protein
MLNNPMKNEFKVVLLIFIFSGSAIAFQANAIDQNSNESSWLALQEAHQGKSKFNKATESEYAICQQRSCRKGSGVRFRRRE